jgi:hypothetical protein
MLYPAIFYLPYLHYFVRAAGRPLCLLGSPPSNCVVSNAQVTCHNERRVFVQLFRAGFHPLVEETLLRSEPYAHKLRKRPLLCEQPHELSRLRIGFRRNATGHISSDVQIGLFGRQVAARRLDARSTDALPILYTSPLLRPGTGAERESKIRCEKEILD